MNQPKTEGVKYEIFGFPSLDVLTDGGRIAQVEAGGELAVCRVGSGSLFHIKS